MTNTWILFTVTTQNKKKHVHILDTKDNTWILGKKYYFNVQDFLMVELCFPTKHTAQCLSVCHNYIILKKVSGHLRPDFFACFYFMYTLFCPAGYM